MMTNYARTLAEATIAKKVNYLAFYLIVNGNDNPGLYELLDQEEKKILKKEKVQSCKYLQHSYQLDLYSNSNV